LFTLLVVDKQKLAIAISFLNKLEVEIKGNIVEFEGTKEFNPYSVEDIFTEKTLLLKAKVSKINRAFLTIFTPNNFINL
jgi:hypothetical protein